MLFQTRISMFLFEAKRSMLLYYIILLSNLSMLRVPNEGYSRNTLCALNVISTFLFNFLSFLCFISNKNITVLKKMVYSRYSYNNNC